MQERGTNVAPGCRNFIHTCVYLSWAVPFPLISVSGRGASPVASDDDPLLLHKYTGKWHNLQPHAIQFTSSDVSSTTFYCDTILQIILVSTTVSYSSQLTVPRKPILKSWELLISVKKSQTQFLRVLTAFARACHTALTWTQNPMQYSPSYEPESCSARKEPPYMRPTFMKSKGSSPFSQDLPEDTAFSQIISAPILAPYFWTSILISSLHLYLGLTRVIFIP